MRFIPYILFLVFMFCGFSDICLAGSPVIWKGDRASSLAPGIESDKFFSIGTNGAGFFEFLEQTANPDTPGSGSTSARLFTKSKKLYYITDDGAGTPVENELGTVNLPAYDSGWQIAEQTFPIPHAIGDLPTAQTFLYDNAGIIRQYPIGQYCSVTSTEIDCEIDSILTIDATHKYRILMTTGAQTAIQDIVNLYDSGWQIAEQTFPLAHGLGEFPLTQTIFYDDNGTIREYPIGQYCYVDATNITCEIDSELTIDGTHPYRIILAVGLVSGFTLSGSVPAGGTTGQVLTKIDATDYNTSWANPSGTLDPITLDPGNNKIIVDDTIEVDFINEKTIDNGVIIEGVSVENGLVGASGVNITRIAPILSIKNTGLTGDGHIWFGDTGLGGDVNIGAITYNHTNDIMYFDVGNNQRFRLQGNGAAVGSWLGNVGGNIPRSCHRASDSLSTTNTISKSCQATEILTGGGCTCTGSFVGFNTNAPITDVTWQCVSNNSCTTITVYTICCTQ